MKYLNIAVILIILLTSCIDQKDYSLSSLDVNPNVSIPLTHGSVSIKDFLSSKDSSYIKTDKDGLLSLVYVQNVLSQDIRGLFSIPNTNASTTLSLPAGSYPQVAQDLVLINLPTIIDLNITPAQLDEINFKSGQITATTSLNPASNLNYEILVSIPEFKSKTNSQPLSIQGKSNLTAQLSNYLATINKNKFTANISVILKKSTAPVTIASNTKVTVQLAFGGMDFIYIKGFLGDQSTTIPDGKLNIAAYGNSLNKANLSLAQPSISLDVSNDYGVPVTINYSLFEARKLAAVPLPIALSPLNPVPLNSPTVLGTSAATTISVTNVNQVINYAPTQFYYSATTRINKGLTSGSNFLADTSKVRVKLNVNIPLYGKGSGITLADTSAIDLSSVDKSEVVEASLKIKITNEIPLDGTVQFYLLDSKYALIDVLLTSSQTSLVRGSSVDGSGNLQTPGVSDQLLPLAIDKINKLFSAKFIIVSALMNTSKDSKGNAVDVKFKSQYKMTIESGISAKLNFNVKL